jgi:hypothetical protein
MRTDDGLPEAKRQRYVLPAGTFFTLRDGPDRPHHHLLQPAGLDRAGLGMSLRVRGADRRGA